MEDTRNQTDHDLMRRCAGGDGLAFDELVRRWQGPLDRVLRRLSVATNDVDDLCQDVFLRILRARDRYRPIGTFSTWIYAIALNVARDRARRDRRRFQPLEEHPASADPSAIDDIGRQEIAWQVQDALNALPAEMREILVLKHFGNLTFAQVAEITGDAVSTVKSRMQVALQRLRAELRRRGIGAEDVLD